MSRDKAAAPLLDWVINRQLGHTTGIKHWRIYIDTSAKGKELEYFFRDKKNKKKKRCCWNQTLPRSNEFHDQIDIVFKWMLQSKEYRSQAIIMARMLLWTNMPMIHITTRNETMATNPIVDQTMSLRPRWLLYNDGREPMIEVMLDNVDSIIVVTLRRQELIDETASGRCHVVFVQLSLQPKLFKFHDGKALELQHHFQTLIPHLSQAVQNKHIQANEVPNHNTTNGGSTRVHSANFVSNLPTGNSSWIHYTDMNKK